MKKSKKYEQQPNNTIDKKQQNKTVPMNIQFRTTLLKTTEMRRSYEQQRSNQEPICSHDVLFARIQKNNYNEDV